MPTFKLTSGDKTLKLTTGTKKFRIRTIDLFGINEGGVPIGVAGGDLSGTYPDPNVSGMKETGAGTNLVIGAIADGQTLVRSGGDIVGSPGTPPGGLAGGDLSGTYPDPSVVALTESSSPASLPIGDIGDDNDVLVRSGTDIVGAHELKDISKIQGGAVASFRGMTFNSVTGEVDILHGSSPTSITGLNMLSLTNRADVAPNSERKILFTADVNSLLSYDVTNEASDASYNTNISDTSVNRSLSFGGRDALTVGNLDETAVLKHRATSAPFANFETKLVLEHERSGGGLIDARAFFGVTKSSGILAKPFGELMMESNDSSLYIGTSSVRLQAFLRDNGGGYGIRLGFGVSPNSNNDLWAVEIAPEERNNGLRIMEQEQGNRPQTVLAFSAQILTQALPNPPLVYNYPQTTAGGTIAGGGISTHDSDAVIGYFARDSGNNQKERDLIITASANMVPSFNDAIKLKNAGGIDIWGDTEFFDTVTAGAFVGPVTGDLWGSVYATDGSGPVLTSPATTPGNVAIDALGATGIIELNTNSTLAMNIDSSQDLKHFAGHSAAFCSELPNGDLGATFLSLGYDRYEDGDANIRLYTEGDAGGAATVEGAKIIRRATADGDFEIRNNGIGSMEFFTNSSLALSVDNVQDTNIYGHLYVNPKGVSPLGSAKVMIGNGADAQPCGIEIGLARVGTEDSSFIDFTTEVGAIDYNTRIIREAGASAGQDGAFKILHKGLDPIEFQTNSALAMSIDSSQDVAMTGDLDIAYGTDSAALLDIAPARTVDEACYIRMFSEAVGIQGARIEKLTGVDSDLNILQVGATNAGNLALKTVLGNFEVYTDSTLAMTIDTNQDTSLKNSLEVEGGNINFLAGNAAVNTNGHLNISCNSTGGSGFNDGTPGIGTFGDIHLDGALVSVGHAGISYSPAGSGGGDVFGGIFFEGGNAVAGTVASTIKMFTGIYGVGTEMMEVLRINTSGIICATDLSVADASFTGSGNFALRVFANLKPTPICIENAAASLTPVQASAYLTGAPDGTIIFGSADGGTLPVFWKDNAGNKWQWIAIGAVLP